MEIISFLATIIEIIGFTIEYIGLFLIAFSVFAVLVKIPMKKHSMENIRAVLAKKIMFGLELIIAADILLATVATDFNQILQLGAIVVIRVILGYALRKEVASKL